MTLPSSVLDSTLLPDEMEIPAEVDGKLRWIGILETQLAETVLDKEKKFLRIPVSLPDDLEDNQVLEIITRLSKFSTYHVHILGVRPFRAYLQEAAQNYIFFFLPLLMIAFFGFLTWYFHSPIPGLIAIPLLGTGAVVSFIAGLFFYGGYSALSSIGLLFVFVVGTSDLIHVLSAIGQVSDITRENLQKAIKFVHWPCLFNSITAVFGFSSFLFSELKTLIVLGISCIVGITACYVLTFFILPLILYQIAKHRPALLNWQMTTRIGVKKLLFKHSGLFTACYLSIAAASLFLIPRIHFEDNFYEKFVPSHPYSVASRTHLEHFGGLDRIDLIYKNDLTTDPQWKSFLKELATVSGIQKTLSYNELKDSLLINVREPLLLEKSAYLFEDSKAVKSFKNNEYERFFLVAQLDSDSKIIELYQKVTNLIRKYYGSDKVTIQSFSYVRARFFENFEEQLRNSIQFTFISIFLTFLVLYRSFRIALIALLINTAPVLIITGAFALIGTKANLNLAILITMLLGLACDDTIHYLHFNRHNVDRPSPVISIPIIITSLVLILGFFIVSLGQVRVFTEISYYMCFGLFLAAFGDIILLPYLLKICARK